MAAPKMTIAEIFAAKNAQEQQRHQIATAKRLAAGAVIDFSEIDVGTQVTQELSEQIASIPHRDLMLLSYAPIDPSKIFDNEDMQRLLNHTDYPYLVGVAYGRIRTEVNKITNDFRPYVEDPTPQLHRSGRFEFAACNTKQVKDLVVQERPNQPTLPVVKVTAEDAIGARLAKGCTKPSMKTQIQDEEGDVTVTQKSIIKLGCTIEVPENDISRELLGPLMMINKKNQFFFPWEAMATYLRANPMTSTGLDHLYWCYRQGRITGDFLTDPSTNTWTYFFMRITDWKCDRAKLGEMGSNSVWHEGAPVPSHILLGNYLNAMPTFKVTGLVPKRVITVARGKTFFVDTSAAPDPNALVRITPTKPIDFNSIEDSCHLAPSSEDIKETRARAIGLPITTPDQISAQARQFAARYPNEKFGAAVIYGSSPWVIIARRGASHGIPADKVDAYAARLAMSYFWVPFYNIGRQRAGIPEVYAVTLGDTKAVVDVTTGLSFYCYLPAMSIGSKNKPLPTWVLGEIQDPESESLAQQVAAARQKRVDADTPPNPRKRRTLDDNAPAHPLDLDFMTEE